MSKLYYDLARKEHHLWKKLKGLKELSWAKSRFWGTWVSPPLTTTKNNNITSHWSRCTPLLWACFDCITGAWCNQITNSDIRSPTSWAGLEFWLDFCRVVDSMKFIHKLFHSRMLERSFPVHSCPRYTANGHGTGKICLPDEVSLYRGSLGREIPSKYRGILYTDRWIR